MSTSSSEEIYGMAGHSAASSGLESTGSLLFFAPSDLSDVQTEITPPTSPAPTEEKMRTPRDILDASRRLGQVSASALQGDPTPTKAPKQSYHRTPPKSVANDEAGYDADGDGDGDESTGAGASATRPIRRPGFLRIDTRQHKRVASMLAARRPSPGFGDPDAHMTDIPRPPHARLVPASAACLRPTTAAGGQAESYELRRRPRLGAEPVGLGIGFPENHPLRSRAFTVPVPVSTISLSPVDVDDDPKLSTGLGREAMTQNVKERRSEWFSSPAWLKKTAQATVCAPSPVRLALRPTFLEVSPSPIEYLPAAAASDAGTFRYGVGVQGRLMVPERDHGRHRMRDMFECGAETERKRPALLAREGESVLSESAVTLFANSEVTTFHVGSHSALSQRAP